MQITDNWMVYENTDQAPTALLFAQERSNLCLRCGVRVWTSDMHIHDGWHARMGV